MEQNRGEFSVSSFLNMIIGIISKNYINSYSLQLSSQSSRKGKMLEILENCVHNVEVIHKSFSELQYVSNLYYLYFRALI